MAALMSITVLLPSLTTTVSAADERSLYLYYTHTGETARITFKRNGRYVQSGLNELNQFLRDWRRNEPAKMDPMLFDLVWEVYQQVGATQPINIVSAYRSPVTNAMLRETSSGVAENSQHMRGKAMDFFIPGIPLAKLRAVAMSKQVGGVGFYPTSGSPFVHLDTGSVRAWPRMTEAQLRDIFPDGRTMHLPTNGRPLSQQGYKLAQAEWQKCHEVPCGGSTRLADNSSGSSRTLMDMFFGDDSKPAPAAASSASSRVEIAAAAPEVAPIPMMRPASLGAPVQLAAVDPAPLLPFGTEGSAPLAEGELTTADIAPVPAVKSQAMLVATAAARPAESGETAVTALAALGQPMPQPRLQMSNPPEAVMAAYAPPMPAEPGAQRALEMMIGDNTPAAIVIPAATTTMPPKPATQLAPAGLRTAALGGEPVGGLIGLFDHTFGAVEQQKPEAPVAKALADFVAADTMRDHELIAPDLEHVLEVFSSPAPLTTGYFASITEHDVADFDPTPELGRYVTVMGVGDEPAVLSHTRFEPGAPLSVAAN